MTNNDDIYFLLSSFDPADDPLFLDESEEEQTEEEE